MFCTSQLIRAIRFGPGVSYRVRALRQEPFPATLPASLQPTYPPTIAAYEELLATTFTPERPHLLETYGFLSTTLLYCHRSHL
jgi:hypothetical protein